KNVRADASGAARAEDGLRLVDEQEGELAFSSLLAALGEQVAYLALRFTEPHVQNLRAFDVQEKLGAILAGLGLDLKPQIMSGRFAQESLAATGRAIEQETFGHRVVEATKQMGVQKRKFDRVANGLHRFLLAANARPGD